MDRTTVRIGVVPDLDAFWGVHELGLILYGGERAIYGRAWRSPLRWLGEPGVVRLAGVAIVWGPAAYLAETVPEQPYPCCIAICTDAPGGAVPSVFGEHVTPFDASALTGAYLFEIDCLPERAYELRLHAVPR